LRLSATIASRKPSGIAWATVLPWNPRTNRRRPVCALGDRSGELEHAGVVVEGAEGADQYDSERPLAVVEGEALGAGAAGVPDDRGRVEPEVVHAGGDVGGVGLGPVAGGGAVGVAVPALGERIAWNDAGSRPRSSFQECHPSL
jgi:hypothetical protein